jgi:hypothetical protein
MYLHQQQQASQARSLRTRSAAPAYALPTTYYYEQVSETMQECRHRARTIFCVINFLYFFSLIFLNYLVFVIVIVSFSVIVTCFLEFWRVTL